MSSVKAGLSGSDGMDGVFANESIGTNMEMKANLSNVINDCKKAYGYCRNVFHQYFRQRLKVAISQNLNKFKVDDYLTSKVMRRLDEMVDKGVMYRLNLTDEFPDYKDLLYEFECPVMMGKSVDDILEELVYGAFDASLLKEFRHELGVYMSNENVIDLFVSKLENEVGR